MSKTKQQMDNEANIFALCLLMPKSMFLDRYEKYQGDHNKLARCFQVSLNHVYMRRRMLQKEIADIGKPKYIVIN